MAQIAFGFGVCAAQRKFRFSGVIECCFLPFHLIVARVAFLTVSGAVNILQLMTGDAALREVLVYLARMTGLAGDILMRAFQRKFRLAVIEWLRVAPFCRRMAGLAFFAESAFVAVVFLVAVKADRGRLMKRLFSRMARLAGDRLMGIDELKIRQIVIETIAVELHDVGRAALMIGVTMPTLEFERIRLAPMIACMRFTIACDVLVACNTQARLAMRAERLVTFIALFFRLAVTLREGAGHHERFDQTLCNCDPRADRKNRGRENGQKQRP